MWSILTSKLTMLKRYSLQLSNGCCRLSVFRTHFFFIHYTNYKKKSIRTLAFLSRKLFDWLLLPSPSPGGTHSLLLLCHTSLAVIDVHSCLSFIVFRNMNLLILLTSWYKGSYGDFQVFGHMLVFLWGTLKMSSHTTALLSVVCWASRPSYFGVLFPKMTDLLAFSFT